MWHVVMEELVIEEDGMVGMVGPQQMLQRLGPFVRRALDVVDGDGWDVDALGLSGRKPGPRVQRGQELGHGPGDPSVLVREPDECSVAAGNKVGGLPDQIQASDFKGHSSDGLSTSCVFESSNLRTKTAGHVHGRNVSISRRAALRRSSTL